jgi:hypothetical protein
MKAAGSGKTQVTQQDRSPCGLETARTGFICTAGHSRTIHVHHQGARETYDDHVGNRWQYTPGPVL